MNQGRIWCVVNPTVGLPLFLGSVAVTSLIVHAAVLTHVPWMANYWAGASKAKMSMETTPPALESKSPAAFSMTVTPVPATDATPASYVITVAPNGQVTTQASLVVPPDATATPIRTASAD